MRAIILFLTSIILFACNNSEKEKAALEQQNQQLQFRLDSIAKANSKTFAFCVFTVSLPQFMEADRSYTDWKTETFISPINELANFNEDVEYKFLDKVEANYRASKMPEWPIKFKERKCMTFKSYAEASKAHDKLLNK